MPETGRADVGHPVRLSTTNRVAVREDVKHFIHVTWKCDENRNGNICYIAGSWPQGNGTGASKRRKYKVYLTGR